MRRSVGGGSFRRRVVVEAAESEAGQWKVQRGMQVALLQSQAPLGPDAERSERPLAHAHWALAASRVSAHTRHCCFPPLCGCPFIAVGKTGRGKGLTPFATHWVVTVPADICSVATRSPRAVPYPFRSPRLFLCFL